MRPFLPILLCSVALVLPSHAGSAKLRPRPTTPVETGDDGYFAGHVTGPGGKQVRIRDYPGSASVITRKMMDDIQPRSVCDALRFSPGVFVGSCR